FSPKGGYGKWLREHAPVAKVGSVIFLHRGISPGLAHLKLDTIDGHVRDEIKMFDATKQYLVDENVILPFFYASGNGCGGAGGIDGGAQITGTFGRAKAGQDYPVPGIRR